MHTLRRNSTFEHVTFYGCKELNPKQLEVIIRQDFPANILRIDLEQLKKRLEKETWIKAVEIRRVLPSDLIIYVQERTPSVILELHGELMVADKDGIMLGQYDPRFGKLDVPVFKGVLGERCRRLSGCIRKRIRRESGRDSQCCRKSNPDRRSATQKISEVDISDPENLKILLVDDTAEVYLGEKDYLKRFQTLMNNLGEYQELKDQNNEIESIDLRFDGQIVYRRRPKSAE